VPVLADHNRRLRRMLDADALTGVNSRVYFFERAQFELARARRRELPVSLILFDIDRFKRINDELGHTAGDQALVSVSKQIRESLRTEDLVGRFGGDEFMVLLTGSAISLALETAERLRNDLHTIPIGEGRDTLTASFSVVEVAGGESLSDAFERADANLLAAKRAGRDRVLGESPAADSPPPASSPATRRR
jgi:diguanylate cyclase (GGDEF)-like protein